MYSVIIDSLGAVVGVTQGPTRAEHVPDGGQTVSHSHYVPLGSTWDGSTFTPPAPVVLPQSWTGLEFKRLFTPSERVAMRTAAKTDPVVEDFLDILDTTAMSGSRIVADDPDLDAGLDYVTAQGLLAAGRKAEILS
jgi:hypothetical protein